MILPCGLRSSELLFWSTLVIATATANHLLAFLPARSNAEDSRWQATASGSAGQAGDSVILTWGFAEEGTQTQDFATDIRKPSNLIASFDAEFGAGPGGDDLTQRPWFFLFEDSFNRLSDLMGVTFIYELNDDRVVHGGPSGILGLRADMRIAGISLDGANGVLAYNYFPNGGGEGDMALDTDDMSNFTNPADNYRFLRNTLMHEVGHGLGLDHPDSDNADFLMEAFIDTTFDGPQHDDLRGFQWFYGDALEKSNSGAGNDSAALATSLGAVSADLGLSVGMSGNGTVVGGDETDFVSITNENDPDYFSFTVTQPVTIDLLMTPRGAVIRSTPPRQATWSWLLSTRTACRC